MAPICRRPMLACRKSARLQLASPCSGRWTRRCQRMFHPPQAGPVLLHLPCSALGRLSRWYSFGAPWCDHKTDCRRATTQLSEIGQVQFSACGTEWPFSIPVRESFFLQEGFRLSLCPFRLSEVAQALDLPIVDRIVQSPIAGASYTRAGSWCLIAASVF